MSEERDSRLGGSAGLVRRLSEDEETVLEDEEDPNTHVKYMVGSIASYMSYHWRHGNRSIIHVSDFPSKQDGHRQYQSVMNVQSRHKCVHSIRADLNCLVRIMTGKGPILSSGLLKVCASWDQISG